MKSLNRAFEKVSLIASVLTTALLVGACNGSGGSTPIKGVETIHFKLMVYEGADLLKGGHSAFFYAEAYGHESLDRVQVGKSPEEAAEEWQEENGVPLSGEHIPFGKSIVVVEGNSTLTHQLDKPTDIEGESFISSLQLGPEDSLAGHVKEVVQSKDKRTLLVTIVFLIDSENTDDHSDFIDEGFEEASLKWREMLRKKPTGETHVRVAHAARNQSRTVRRDLVGPRTSDKPAASAKASSANI